MAGLITSIKEVATDLPADKSTATKKNAPKKSTPKADLETDN